MAQSTVTVDRALYQGVAGSTGGTFAATYAIPTDKACVLRATAIGTAASVGHQIAACYLAAEYFIQNKNGTLAVPSAISGSANPSNSNSATFDGSHAESGDLAISDNATPASLVWANSSTNAVCTWTTTGATAANVTIIIDATIVGST